MAMPDASFAAYLVEHTHYPLLAAGLDTLQVNVGRKCNQSCRHCHVEAGPERGEMMERETMDQLLSILADPRLHSLDITGGAPELHPELPRLIEAGAELGKEVIVRCNLTALALPQCQGLIELFRRRGVHIVSSLPCYTQENVDSQRGQGAYSASIATLKELNACGYGREEQLVLDLVYNPGGAFLPCEQKVLQADYKRQLFQAHGIVFNNLLTITNMAIGRFRGQLREEGALAAYQALLRENFNPATLPGLMCLRQLSVGWDGRIFDCDFNQMLGLSRGHIADFDYDALASRTIFVANHCFACTAGAGSSCGGALLEA